MYIYTQKFIPIVLPEMLKKEDLHPMLNDENVIGFPFPTSAG